MKIKILGGGSFGLALAMHLNKKHNVKVWEYFKERLDSLNSRHCPLLNVDIPENITFSASMENVLIDADLVIIAVASAHVKSVLGRARITSPVLIASKGFDDSLMLLSELVEEKLAVSISILSGPTIAKEFVKGISTCADIACKDKALADNLCKEFSYDNLKCVPNGDIIGVQIGGALKNIIAVWGGICDGLEMGMNTKSAFMTLGIKEISRLGIKMGALEETFYGLSGIGDLIVTCSSKNSRNRQLGEMLGKGLKLREALDKMTMVAEGVHTVKVAKQLSDKFDVDMPLTRGLYSVLNEGKNPKEVLEKILK